MKRQILQLDESNRRLRDEAQAMELEEKSPELCLSTPVVTYAQLSQYSTDEKQTYVDMIDSEPHTTQDQPEVISKMIQLKHESSSLLKENKLLKRKLSASEAREA